VVYFAASTDDAETNKKFAESLDLDYPILSDPDKKVATALGVLGSLGFASRATVYIDANGKIAFIDRDVKTAGHGRDIAAKLTELGAPKK